MAVFTYDPDLHILSWLQLWLICIACSSAYLFLFLAFAKEPTFDSALYVYLTLPNLGILLGILSNDFELDARQIFEHYKFTHFSFTLLALSWHLVWNAMCASFLWTMLH